jgi:hypothetical protein
MSTSPEVMNAVIGSVSSLVPFSWSYNVDTPAVNPITVGCASVVEFGIYLVASGFANTSLEAQVVLAKVPIVHNFSR